MMNYRVLYFYYMPTDDYGTAGHTRAKVVLKNGDVMDVSYGPFLMEQAKREVSKPVSIQKAEAFRTEYMSILRGHP